MQFYEDETSQDHRVISSVFFVGQISSISHS